MTIRSLLPLFGLLAALHGSAAGSVDVLPGTEPLTMSGDVASNLVAGLDRFLLRKLDAAERERDERWSVAAADPAQKAQAMEVRRQRFAQILGVRDARPAKVQLERFSTDLDRFGLAAGNGYSVTAVRWPAFGDVHGEGLLLRPTTPASSIVPWVVAIPDAFQLPEDIAGLSDRLPATLQYARRLAESGCQVLIPTLIDRQVGLPKTEEIQRATNLTSREFVYRSAFELGRHVIGYEVQKVLAAVDAAGATAGNGGPRVGVIGWGEGGLLAFYAAALDPRISAVATSGFFDRRVTVWRQPVDRNIFGLLQGFSDAEVAALIAPRALIVEAARGPDFLVPPGTGGAPGRLTTPGLSEVRSEFEQARRWAGTGSEHWSLVVSGDGTGPMMVEETLERFLQALAVPRRLAPVRPTPKATGIVPDGAARHASQLRELDRHNQWLLQGSAAVRQQFMSRLDTRSPAAYARTSDEYREHFREQVIGRFADAFLPPLPRSRKFLEDAKWTAYEVVLDVYPDVFAYGLLLLPNGLREGERRPVVVCQHGLEGRPQDTIGKASFEYYAAFAAQLAERGFVTFAPQNPYLFGDRFRTLQRKANPLGKTLFSLIVPQHQQITDWLRQQPFVDPNRIAFYGLSYGGKTAMRVPALVTNYCLSICSADFNEWVWKNASTRSPYSYVWTGEYEIFEFDLGSTFNYAEMAALIAPRPFMVERGHFDGVAPDETVAYEFAKVRHLYQARLGLGDRCAIEWFVGPHSIHGQGTFDFLHQHLQWPKP